MDEKEKMERALKEAHIKSTIHKTLYFLYYAVVIAGFIKIYRGDYMDALPLFVYSVCVYTIQALLTWNIKRMIAEDIDFEILDGEFKDYSGVKFIDPDNIPDEIKDELKSRLLDFVDEMDKKKEDK